MTSFKKPLQLSPSIELVNLNTKVGFSILRWIIRISILNQREWRKWAKNGSTDYMNQ